MSFRLSIGAVALLALGGCDTLNQNNVSPDPGFGEAVKYNAAVQIIDPDPVYDEAGSQPGDSGAKGAAAVKRYRTDTVKAVERVETTSGATGGSGGGPQ
ncbi:MAG: hypothetical protein ABIR87_06685 [Sphingomicrobium sp.]